MIEKTNISQFAKNKSRGSVESWDTTAKALFHLEDKINEIIEVINNGS